VESRPVQALAGAGEPKVKILVVEDDTGTREIVARALKRAGYEVIEASTGCRALELVASARPGLVVLDVGLPDVDGFEVCRQLRLRNQVPIVMLTARDEEDDVMRAFKLGADDYVTKPFSARLLTARVAVVLRRAVEAGKDRRADHVKVGGLALDVPSHQVRMDGHEVRLTPLEFRLLHILAANAGRVVPHGRLIEFAWGHEDANPLHLKIRIHALRTKLGLAARGEPTIAGIKGTGYALRGF
jgi:DNA-binding response OmpR family regulator